MSDKITYIWDQKPEKEEYHSFNAHSFTARHFGLYRAKEMDDWLEKLKVLYEALADTVIEQDKIISQFKE